MYINKLKSRQASSARSLVIHLISTLCLVSGCLLSSYFIRSETSLHSLTKHYPYLTSPPFWICLTSLTILYSYFLGCILDSLPTKSSVGPLLELSVGQERKTPYLRIIETLLKTISFISLKIKQIVIPHSFSKHKDNLSSLFVRVLCYKIA